MKILYIHSGYHGIYSYLEDSIIGSFKKNGFKVLTLSATASINDFSEVFNNNHLNLVFTLIGANISRSIHKFLEDISTPFCIWLTEDPFDIDKSLKIINEKNIIFTIELEAYKFYKNKGFKNIFYLPLGTNPEIFKKVEPSEPYLSDILLLGYPYPSRVNLAKLILENTNYKLTLVGSGWHNRIPKNFRRLKKLLIIDKWVSPVLASLFYNGAKIIINHHRETDFIHNSNSLNIESNSINNRTFDISSCGAFQLINYKEDLYSQYLQGEIVHYINPSDCIKKIEHFIKEDDLRNLIAYKAQHRVQSNHTWDTRILSIIDIVKRYTTL
ncbi:CgeB family protein [Priestia aryabhattai]|uniref:CgeB family protein n=1 Tax=Priestia aryabhattai TaxID=412384 RepID=UPI0008DD6E3C|nr:DUF3880 domain-containing protein [Priestia aryabhattai]OHY73460.1 hypothetical protein BCV52_26645 [Priestia aryabhattai]